MYLIPLRCLSTCCCCAFAVSCSKNALTEPNVNPLIEIFIAHAGGAIDGYTYTNSLEALNSSYAAGCRLFEMDFMETSDSVLVAVHLWSEFKSKVGWQEINDEPLSHQEFLSQRIYERYTPMDIYAVNAWFKEHKDAMLVTDCLFNKPKVFTKYFPYKDRLIMELSSWEAISEALEIGIKVMPNDNLIFSTPNVEQVLESLNIRYVTVSRRILLDNEDFFLRLKSKGIKTYVYHVNWDEGKDEKYVFENEMYMITGMFADDLSILELSFRCK